MEREGINGAQYPRELISFLKDAKGGEWSATQFQQLPFSWPAKLI